MPLTNFQFTTGVYAGFLNVLYRPRIRPGMGDPAAIQVHRAIARRRFEEVERIVTAQTNAEDREFVLAMAATAPDGETWTKEILDAHPRSPIAHTLAGKALVELAGKARGYDRARNVTVEGWKGFFEYLQQARDILTKATELEPRDASPWVGLQGCAIGLEEGLEESTRRFKQAVRRAPNLLAAHLVHMSALTPKWGGDFKQFSDFHWRVVAAAPSGHPLHVLACRASIEDMIDAMFKDGAKVKPWEFLAQPHIVQRVKTAYMNYFSSPTYIHGRGARHHRAFFAMLFAVAGERELAREQFQHIGRDASEQPWGFVFGPNVKRGMRIARAWSGRFIG